MLTVPDLPALGWPAEVMDTVRLIDVIWLRPDTAEMVAAFEVEKSTRSYLVNGHRCRKQDESTG